MNILLNSPTVVLHFHTIPRPSVHKKLLMMAMKKKPEELKYIKQPTIPILLQNNHNNSNAHIILFNKQ